MPKRSPTRIIEEGNTKIEQAYLKLPRQELQNISGPAGKNSVYTDEEKLKSLLKNSGRNKYTVVHTHTIGVFPSLDDFANFLNNKAYQTMVIAQRSKEGKVEGYGVFRKTARTPGFSLADPLILMGLEGISYLSPLASLGMVVQGYNLKCRFVPVKGYTLNKRLKFVEKNKESELEGKFAATASIVGILAGLFFLSSNLTGNVIANISQSSSNVLGAVLLVVGLVAGFFWVKKKYYS
jgi:hypothetical protein